MRCAKNGSNVPRRIVHKCRHGTARNSTEQHGRTVQKRPKIERTAEFTPQESKIIPQGRKRRTHDTISMPNVWWVWCTGESRQLQQIGNTGLVQSGIRRCNVEERVRATNVQVKSPVTPRRATSFPGMELERVPIRLSLKELRENESAVKVQLQMYKIFPPSTNARRDPRKGQKVPVIIEESPVPSKSAHPEQVITILAPGPRTSSLGRVATIVATPVSGNVSRGRTVFAATIPPGLGYSSPGKERPLPLLGARTDPEPGLRERATLGRVISPITKNRPSATSVIFKNPSGSGTFADGGRAVTAARLIVLGTALRVS